METLTADPRFDVVGVAADAPGAIEGAVRERPDLCLLDIRMPGSGIGAAWEITARLPETKVVMLTASEEDEHLFAALRAGASGYLLKDLEPSRLPSALDAVLSGEAAIPRSLVARLVDDFRDRGPRRRRRIATEDLGAQLTSREWEILDLMRNGDSTQQIARRLSLTPATVRSHIASAVKKLRVPDREAALKLFEER